MPGESARINGRKGGRPENETKLKGLTNLDNEADPVYRGSASYPSMKAAAFDLKISIDILRDARARNCPAFGASGAVHRGRLVKWLKDNPYTAPQNEHVEDSELEDSYEVDEAGGVGKALKSLQTHERQCKRELDQARANKTLSRPEKAALVKEKHDVWIKTLNALLKYDINVTTAKRDAGELIPLAEAQKGVQALLSWLCVADSDALRNAIPECENKNRYQIAAIMDPIFRGSKIRNFKLGEKLGKIPEWLSITATTFTKSSPVMGVEKTLEEQLDEY